MVGHIYGPKMQIDEGEIRCNIGNLVVSWDVRCGCGSTCMHADAWFRPCPANAVTRPSYLGPRTMIRGPAAKSDNFPNQYAIV
jgi:hypothetical protein